MARALLICLLLFRPKCETADALPGNQTPPQQKPANLPKLSFSLRRVKAVLSFGGPDGGFYVVLSTIMLQLCLSA